MTGEREIRLVIARAIKEARGAKSLTEVAHALGVHSSTPGRWENEVDPDPPPFDKVVRLSEYLGVSVVQLAYGRAEFYRRVSEGQEPFYERVVQEAVRRIRENL